MLAPGAREPGWRPALRGKATRSLTGFLRVNGEFRGCEDAAAVGEEGFGFDPLWAGFEAGEFEFLAEGWLVARGFPNDLSGAQIEAVGLEVDQERLVEKGGGGDG